MYYNKLPKLEQTKLVKSINYLYERYLLQKPFLIAKSNYDVNFKIKADDTVGEEIYKSGDYEKLLTNFITNNIHYTDRDVILDVGADLGWYSLILDKTIKNNIRIYAFEPDEFNYKLLFDNVKLNNATRVTPIKKAISNETGQKNLYQFPGKNLGKRSLLPIDNAKITKVDAITLDEFVMQQGIDPHYIKLLKVEVEGYEGYVFLKASNVLDHVQYVIHGFTPSTMYDTTITPRTLIALLIRKGLSPFIITETGLKATNKEQILQHIDEINLLWIRL